MAETAISCPNCHTRIATLRSQGNFTTLDLFRTNPYGAIWYNRAAFAPLEEEYTSVAKESLDVAQNRWFDEKIPGLTPTALFT